MPYVGADFSPMDVVEDELFTIDFVNDVAPTSTFTGSIAGSTLTVNAVATAPGRPGGFVQPGGFLQPGLQIVSPSVAWNTLITGQTSGVPGGPGSYTVSISQVVPQGLMNAIEAITSAVWTCSAIEGEDPNAGNCVDGAASFLGTMTTQRVSGLLAAVKYRLDADVTTTLANNKNLYSHVPAQQPN